MIGCTGKRWSVGRKYWKVRAVGLVRNCPVIRTGWCMQETTEKLHAISKYYLGCLADLCNAIADTRAIFLCTVVVEYIMKHLYIISSFEGSKPYNY
jgi:hypothetical protein